MKVLLGSRIVSLKITKPLAKAINTAISKSSNPLAAIGKITEILKVDFGVASRIFEGFTGLNYKGQKVK